MRSPSKSKVAAATLLVVLGWLGVHEGTRYRPYRDAVGVWTVCRGITNAVLPGFVVPGQVRTEAECHSAELRVIQEQIVPALEQCVHAPLGQNQHAALIDLAWNVGTPAVCGSTLVRKFNAGDCRGAGDEFLRWVWAGGKRWPGLVSRRRVEARAFLQDCV